jgi:Autographiviridae endonuclease VII
VSPSYIPTEEDSLFPSEIIIGKVCTKCGGDPKPFDEFCRNSAGSYGRASRCRKCMSEAHRLWREKNPEWGRQWFQERPRYHRKWRLKNFYNMTIEQADILLECQGGGCAICGSSEPGGKGEFHVDHDHACCPGEKSCGKCIRGLLCGSCNMSLGLFHDDPDLLRRAIDYLTGGYVTP